MPGKKRTPFVLYRYKVRGVPRLMHCATLERVAISIVYIMRQTELLWVTFYFRFAFMGSVYPYQ